MMLVGQWFDVIAGAVNINELFKKNITNTKKF